MIWEQICIWRNLSFKWKNSNSQYAVVMKAAQSIFSHFPFQWPGIDIDEMNTLCKTGAHTLWVGALAISRTAQSGSKNNGRRARSEISWKYWVECLSAFSFYCRSRPIFPSSPVWDKRAGPKHTANKDTAHNVRERNGFRRPPADHEASDPNAGRRFFAPRVTPATIRREAESHNSRLLGAKISAAGPLVCLRISFHSAAFSHEKWGFSSVQADWANFSAAREQTLVFFALWYWGLFNGLVARAKSRSLEEAIPRANSLFYLV